MNDLTHQGRPILQKVVKDLGLYRKPSGARPFGVPWLQLASKLRGLEDGRNRVEVGRIGIDRGRSAVRL